RGNPGGRATLGSEANDHAHSRDDPQREDVADEGGDYPACDHRGAGNGQRTEAVDQPGVHVLSHARTGGQRGDGDGLDEDSGHQIVGVTGVLDVDGAAEDVAEQQHEDDRRTGRRRQLLGAPEYADEDAPGNRERVGYGPGGSSSAQPGRAGWWMQTEGA